ncbi:uncharacterized protein L201_005744 [Kwoniella dendrophila CBS 6074]|uniref:SWIM-type domain-containing protein n=1 Tax=Kwoniella dendrophila CBS 6074 TaxID=1295534 RepID=A0AAX4K1N2_9TREE
MPSKHHHCKAPKTSFLKQLATKGYSEIVDELVKYAAGHGYSYLPSQKGIPKRKSGYFTFSCSEYSTNLWQNKLGCNHILLFKITSLPLPHNEDSSGIYQFDETRSQLYHDRITERVSKEHHNKPKALRGSKISYTEPPLDEFDRDQESIEVVDNDSVSDQDEAESVHEGSAIYPAFSETPDIAFIEQLLQDKKEFRDIEHECNKYAKSQGYTYLHSRPSVPIDYRIDFNLCYSYSYHPTETEPYRTDCQHVLSFRSTTPKGSKSNPSAGHFILGNSADVLPHNHLPNQGFTEILGSTKENIIHESPLNQGSNLNRNSIRDSTMVEGQDGIKEDNVVQHDKAEPANCDKPDEEMLQIDGNHLKSQGENPCEELRLKTLELTNRNLSRRLAKIEIDLNSITQAFARLQVESEEICERRYRDLLSGYNQQKKEIRNLLNGKSRSNTNGNENDHNGQLGVEQTYKRKCEGGRRVIEENIEPNESGRISSEKRVRYGEE